MKIQPNELRRNAMWLAFVCLVPQEKCAACQLKASSVGPPWIIWFNSLRVLEKQTWSQWPWPSLQLCIWTKPTNGKWLVLRNVTKCLNTSKPVGEICVDGAQLSRVTAGVFCVQATVINLLTVKVMDHFLCYRIIRAAPGRTPDASLGAPMLHAKHDWAVFLIKGWRLMLPRCSQWPALWCRWKAASSVMPSSFWFSNSSSLMGISEKL